MRWYQGIVGVQRLLPFYAFAEDASQVRIMIPAGILQGGLELVRSCWTPLARRHAPASFFANRAGLAR